MEAEGLEPRFDDKPREKDQVRLDTKEEQCANKDRRPDRRDEHDSNRAEHNTRAGDHTLERYHTRAVKPVSP